MSIDWNSYLAEDAFNGPPEALVLVWRIVDVGRDTCEEHALDALDGALHLKLVVEGVLYDRVAPLLLAATRSLKAQVEAQAAELAELKQRLDALVRTALLPVCPSLLDDEDPIPLYTLKLLVALLEAHPALVLVRPVTRLRNKPNLLGGRLNTEMHPSI